jgi:hypothetical protein
VALLGALLLVFTLFIRPQEFIPALQSVGLLNIAVGAAVLGTIIEFATGKIKSAWSPQLPFLAAFLIWCVGCTLIKVGVEPTMELKSTLGFSTIFMLVVMYAGRTLTNFRVICALLLGIAITFSLIGVDEAHSEFECFALEKEANGEVAHDQSEGVSDGRNCEHWSDCAKDGKPDVDYVCEKPGPAGTFTVASGRVRWRGTFADPNELALAIGAAMSFAFAFHAAMRKWIRHVLLAIVLALAIYCVILTGSRGGVLVLLVIFGAYFIRRYGAKGVILGVLAGLLLLSQGGRSGEDAESSSLERLGALYDGIDFFRQTPVFGLGCGQFTENYFITAHNSYLLAAAELGFPGMLLWTMLVYVSIKIPFMLAFRTPIGLDPRIPPFALALTLSFAGTLVGIFFLSFCYHNMLFIYFGLSGALYGIAKASFPQLDIRVKLKEIGAVAAVDAMLLVALFVYTHLIKGAP